MFAYECVHAALLLRPSFCSNDDDDVLLLYNDIFCNVRCMRDGDRRWWWGASVLTARNRPIYVICYIIVMLYVLFEWRFIILLVVPLQAMCARCALVAGHRPFCSHYILLFTFMCVYGRLDGSVRRERRVCSVTGLRRGGKIPISRR